MKTPYRKSFIDKLSSPEQLNKTIRVTSAYSWIALVAITAMIAVTVVWAFTEYLPTTVTVNGMIVSATTPTNTIRAKEGGTLQGICSAGERMFENDYVYQINGQQYAAGFVGYAAEILAYPGPISAGDELIRVRSIMSANQKEVVVCYVPVSDVDKIRLGWPANVYLSSTDGNTYGYIHAKVINIDTAPTSNKGIETAVGVEMVSTFSGSGPVCAVTCELESADGSKNGYLWSTQKGMDRTITAPLLCSVKIITDMEHPITMFVSKLKDIWENKQ